MKDPPVTADAAREWIPPCREAPGWMHQGCSTTGWAAGSDGAASSRRRRTGRTSWRASTPWWGRRGSKSPPGRSYPLTGTCGCARAARPWPRPGAGWSPGTRARAITGTSATGVSSRIGPSRFWWRRSLLGLSRCIHLNPLLAKVVADLAALDRSPWTRHSALLGRVPRRFQAVAEVLRVSGRFRAPASGYRQFVADGSSQSRRSDLRRSPKLRSGVPVSSFRRGHPESLPYQNLLP